MQYAAWIVYLVTLVLTSAESISLSPLRFKTLEEWRNMSLTHAFFVLLAAAIFQLVVPLWLLNTKRYSAALVASAPGLLLGGLFVVAIVLGLGQS